MTFRTYQLRCLLHPKRLISFFLDLLLSKQFFGEMTVLRDRNDLVRIFIKNMEQDIIYSILLRLPRVYNIISFLSIKFRVRVNRVKFFSWKDVCVTITPCYKLGDSIVDFEWSRAPISRLFINMIEDRDNWFVILVKNWFRVQLFQFLFIFRKM